MGVEADFDFVFAVKAAGVALHGGGFAVGGHHFAVLGGAVAASEAEQVHGFQKIGFAAAVGAVEHSGAGVQGKIQRRIVAELLQFEMGKVHGGSAPSLKNDVDSITQFAWKRERKR